jgi:HK97 family phage portal protein
VITERLARGLGEVRNVTLTSPIEELAALFGGAPTLAGVNVNTATSFALPAFYAGVKILAESMGVMPCEVRRAVDGVAQPAPESRLYRMLHDQPNREMHAGDFWELITTHVAIRGNGYAYKERDEYGRVIGLWPVPPHRVQIQRDPSTREKIYLISRDWEDAEVYPFRATDLIHFRGFGPDPLVGLSPIGALRELLGRASAEQDYQSALMRNQARPSGVLRTDKKLNEARGRRLARRFKRSVSGVRRAGEIVILEEGLQWQSVSMSAADAQFIQQRDFTIKDIARVLRIPAEMLLVETGGSLHYSSDETVPLRFLTFTMMPWIRRTEGPLSIDTDLPWTMTGPTQGRLFPAFQPDVLHRVDRKTRFEAYQVAIDSGWMTPDEARVLEGLAPKGLNQTKPLTAPTAPQKRSAPPDENDDSADDLDRLMDGALA